MRKQFFNRVIVIALFIACISSIACNKASVKSEPAIPALNSSSSLNATDSTYQLVWSDEFNGTGAFDSTKWAFCPRQTSAWNEYLTSLPAYASQDGGGNLVLKMDNATIAGDPVPYHSGGIQSLGKFSIAYGKIEVSAKFTQGQGSWPAIWMMPVPATADTSSWPGCGEMDIMEHINNSSVINETVHNLSVDNANGASSATHTASYNTTGYNTYGLVWTPTAVQFYVNNVLQYTYNKVASGGWHQYPYNVPFYIILNQSGGAGWPGPITNSNLPFTMQVDYVRVYQLQ